MLPLEYLTDLPVGASFVKRRGVHVRSQGELVTLNVTRVIAVSTSNITS